MRFSLTIIRKLLSQMKRLAKSTMLQEVVLKRSMDQKILRTVLLLIIKVRLPCSTTCYLEWQINQPKAPSTAMNMELQVLFLYLSKK